MFSWSQVVVVVPISRSEIGNFSLESIIFSTYVRYIRFSGCYRCMLFRVVTCCERLVIEYNYRIGVVYVRYLTCRVGPYPCLRRRRNLYLCPCKSVFSSTVFELASDLPIRLRSSRLPRCLPVFFEAPLRNSELRLVSLNHVSWNKLFNNSYQSLERLWTCKRICPVQTVVLASESWEGLSVLRTRTLQVLQALPNHPNSRSHSQTQKQLLYPRNRICT